MTQRKTAKATAEAREHSRAASGENEDFERPDAETAAQGGAAHEQAEPAGADPRAPRNDARHGYSQDSGYATSGGPSKGDAQKPKHK